MNTYDMALSFRKSGTLIISEIFIDIMNMSVDNIMNKSDDHCKQKLTRLLDMTKMLGKWYRSEITQNDFKNMLEDPFMKLCYGKDEMFILDMLQAFYLLIVDNFKGALAYMIFSVLENGYIKEDIIKCTLKKYRGKYE